MIEPKYDWHIPSPRQPKGTEKQTLWARFSLFLTPLEVLNNSVKFCMCVSNLY